MRYLRKIDGDGTLWPWTEALSRRRDMQEVTVANTPAPVPAAPADDKPVGGLPDVYSITDRDELRAIAKEHGIKVGPNAAVTTMQSIIAAELGIPPVEE